MKKERNAEWYLEIWEEEEMIGEGIMEKKVGEEGNDRVKGEDALMFYLFIYFYFEKSYELN